MRVLAMDKFQSLKFFIRVVESGSFSATAKELMVSQANVSKQINELENELSIKLLSRTTRTTTLTEAGKLFYNHAKEILERFDIATSEMKDLKQAAGGVVRLASPVFFGRKFITPTLKKFNELYPDIIVEHYLSDSQANLVKEGIDITIRIGTQMTDSTLISRKLASIKRITVASKDLLLKYGIPKSPLELESMPCLIYLGSEFPTKWIFIDTKGNEIIVNVKGQYRTDSLEAIREATIAGMGVMRGPITLFDEELKSGQLVRILDDYKNESSSIFAVTLPSLFTPKKTKLLIEFLQKEFRNY
jgi:DNA-binding transcriptional LysR family regulator